jgi:single-stranded-DNA-specific exonuclease
LISNSTIGRDEEHRLLTVQDETGATQRVLWWHGFGWPLPEGRFDLAYAVRAVTYRGQREVQVEWIDFRPIELPPGSAQRTEDTIVLDYRHIPHPLGVLKQILAQEEVIVWAEGEAVKKLAGENVRALDRFNLSSAPVLAIWTTPPGRSELLAVLDYVKPARILVFAISPDADFLDKFINKLAGMVKYSLNTYQGRLNLEKLAAATAQRVMVVRKGIDWLAGKGFIRITGEEAGIVMVEESDSSKVNVENSPLSRELSGLLEEVRAYRDYFSRVPEIKL